MSSEQPVEQKPQTERVVASGLQPRGNFAETEIAGTQREFIRKRTVPLTQEGVFLRDTHATTPPGIVTGATALKNKYRSSNSPATQSANAIRSNPPPFSSSKGGNSKPPKIAQATRERATNRVGRRSTSRSC